MTPLPDNLLESVAAAAVREGLADALFTHVGTPIGRLLVVSGPNGILRIAFEREDHDADLAYVARHVGPRVLASDREMVAVRDAIEAYFAGDLAALDLPYDLRLVRSDFRRQALETLAREVGPGQVVTYGQLAERTANPRAARATGTACATNPVPIVVPCHRVVPSTGGVGNYGGGPDLKVRLLEHEGVLVPTLPALRTPRS